MPQRTLPEHPNLDHLRAQAKDLHARAAAAKGDAKLSDAQLVLAREYGFPSWPRLRREVLFRRLLRLIENGEAASVRKAVDADRWLVAYPEDGSPTALHWAAWHSHIPVLEVLVRYGADIDRDESKFGARPAGWANENGRDAARDWLISHGAKVDLSRAAMMGRLDLVEQILAEDPEAAHRVDAADWPPLVQAAGWGRLEVMRVLLAAGAGVNAAGAEGTTPLHAAISWDGHVSAAKLLLASGADPTLTDHRGQTAQDLAARHDEPEWVALLGVKR